MSVTIDSTNPRIIADNIRKLDDAVKSAASELPEVETTDAGKVLTVNSSGKWAASDLPPYPVGNLDYSETEQDTGVKWIDGKNVYFRVLSGITPDNDTPSIDVECPFDTIIKFYGTVGTVDFNKNISATWLATKTGVRIYKTTSYLSTPFKLIAFYTKPSATLNASPDRELNAAPEQETASEPESEPVLKKVTKKKTTTKEEE